MKLTISLYPNSAPAASLVTSAAPNRNLGSAQRLSEQRMLDDSRDLTSIAATHESVQRAAIASLRSVAMRRRRPLILAACVVAVLLGVGAGPASATTVTVLGHDGRTHIVDNPYLTGAAADPTLPAPAPPAASSARRAGVARAGHATSARKRPKPPKTVTFAQALAKLRGSGCALERQLRE